MMKNINSPQNIAVSVPQAPQDQILYQDKSKSINQNNLFEEQKQQKYPFIQKILDNQVVNILISLITIYALFGDDVRVIAFDRYADYYFDILSILSLCVFCIEIILNLFVRDDYFNTFFFWLDLISTLSLLMDVQLFTTAIGLTGNRATSTIGLARAGRASRVGTKAGRVVRLVRLIRIVKLYKQTDIQMKKKIHEINSESYDNLQESKVSKKLSDLTTKRMIIIVLMLLLIMPLFSTDYYTDPPKSLDYLLANLKLVAENTDDVDFYIWAESQCHQRVDETDTPLALLETPLNFTKNYNSKTYNILRVDEIDYSSVNLNLTAFIAARGNSKNEANIISIQQAIEKNNSNPQLLVFNGGINLKWTNQRKSIFSLGTTVFVCLILTIGAMMFSKDANDLALRPIERMIEKVKLIAKNPKHAIEVQLVNDDVAVQYETVLIENAIIKIGTLLALGFGDAGSEIIASNMSKQGEVDPMIPGKKKCCIYGFCDIRNFTDATEVLQEDVMIFVNNIGDIVHQMCDRYAGAANKNIGDAFLLVWKLQDGTYSINKDNSVQYLDKKYVEQYADCSLITFMKVNAKMNREIKILKYREDERLQRRLKNYRVKLGLGLHIGWSIEGAIGSEFKIDASYLSPSVNMASRLEGCTKAFGIPMLISGDLYQCFSTGVQKFTRQVDNVIFKGASRPMGLYTIDMDVEKLPVSKDPMLYLDSNERKFILREKKKKITEQLINKTFSGEEYFKKNKDLRIILRQWNQIFQEQFTNALKCYIDGDWERSKKKFEDVIKIAPNDGPTQAIYEFLKENKFQVPEDWKGYRVLVE